MVYNHARLLRLHMTGGRSERWAVKHLLASVAVLAN